MITATQINVALICLFFFAGWLALALTGERATSRKEKKVVKGCIVAMILIAGYFIVKMIL